MKAEEFTCASSQFTTPFVSRKMGSCEESRDILQIEQILAEDLARSVLPWRVWLLLQAGCSTVKV